MSSWTFRVVFVTFLSTVCTKASLGQLNTENVVINVTVGTLTEGQLKNSSNLQINFNVSVGDEQLFVNDVPVTGVTRLNCQALLLLDGTNGSSEFESGGVVSTVMLVMVNQNRLYRDPDGLWALRVFSAVVEMDGKQVEQPEMSDVKILMSPESQKLSQFADVDPIVNHSEIFRVPADEDVVVTDTFDLRSVEASMTQTTSHYPLKHTTQEETAAPGKLPETPLRMDPDLLYDEEVEDLVLHQMEPNQMETPPKESSYSAICRWVEEMRERLRRFCSESLPVFFLVMFVVVVGVVGSAIIVKILDLFFPACEPRSVSALTTRHIFRPTQDTPVAEDEKQVLLDKVETEDQEQVAEEKP
ncbi:glycoprotein integral membrane protein 1 [Thalassophryne amazonica]|uniref:glycoprotein integral membrane protein 1 n=1 Tax=Thalassophryne amazonica TaxID=390379 RepID=UPI00147141D3|nr:glycoprotein integral membrane protein 1 [Thalassophryne amazonica]